MCIFKKIFENDFLVEKVFESLHNSSIQTVGPELVKQWILSLEKHDGEFNERKKDDIRLIIGYSENRAKKDRHNREKGIKRLQQAYKSGKITKKT